MSKFKAVDDIKKFGRMLEGFMEFSKELEQIASLEQFEKEIEDRIVKLKADESIAISSYESAKAKLEEIEVMADKIIEDAKADAESMKSKAMSEKEEILKNAEADAMLAVNGAHEAASSKGLEIQELEGKILALDKEVKEKEDKLSDLNSKIDTIKARLS